MKNLNVFNGNTHDFLDDVVNSKRNTQDDPTYKERLAILTPNVKLCFNSFDVAHNTNNHISLVPHGYVTPDKDDLLKLYNPKAKKLVDFKNTATTILDNRASTICQYCTINSANTLDHIVPKSQFSEFTVNPKNLLPACSECNGYKLDRFKNNNVRLFLNLYTDTLPSDQYLFVDIKILNGMIEVDDFQKWAATLAQIGKLNAERSAALATSLLAVWNVFFLPADTNKDGSVEVPELITHMTAVSLFSFTFINIIFH